MRRAPAARLQGLVSRTLQSKGVSEHDAAVAAEVLVFTELRGIASHGIRRLPNYLKRAELGLIADSSELREVAGRGPIRRLDAAHALGAPAAVLATDRACDLAGEHGVGVVALGRATHFGVAGFYALRMAKRGLIGLVLSNAPKAVAPYGAREPFLGTNPLAIAAPLGQRTPLLLDMSTSSIPKARIRSLMEAGADLEPGCALDAHGRPTTDPGAALQGSILPLGGPKGSGLAFAIALLAGILAEAQFDHEMPSIYTDFEQPQNLGQLFAALDPCVFVTASSAAERAESLVDALHALAPAHGFTSVLHAGEPGTATSVESTREGISLAERDLETIAAECDAALRDEWRGLGDATASPA